MEIKLNVRGNCCLIPGEKYSKHIEVISVIDRYLEHARSSISTKAAIRWSSSPAATG